MSKRVWGYSRNLICLPVFVQRCNTLQLLYSIENSALSSYRSASIAVDIVTRVHFRMREMSINVCDELANENSIVRGSLLSLLNLFKKLRNGMGNCSLCWALKHVDACMSGWARCFPANLKDVQRSKFEHWTGFALIRAGKCNAKR